MTTMMVQIKIKDYGEWKKVFDSAASVRKAGGEISHQIFRDASDPHKLTNIFKYESMAVAQKWAQSPELKAAMEKAGVQGPPSVTFLEEMM
jgi:quinol monooxygenase YgiN